MLMGEPVLQMLAVLCCVGYRGAMVKRIKKSILLLYRAGDNLVDHHGVEMAGYLSFLALLSLFPYLVLMVSAAGLIGQGEAGRQFITFMLQHLPHDAVATIRPRIEEIISGPPPKLLTFSILGALWTSSSGVEALRGVFNRAYQVGNPPSYYWRRLVSIIQILIFTGILMVVMLALVITPLAFNHLNEFTGLSPSQAVENFIRGYFLYIGAGILFVLVSVLYYILPNIKQEWIGVLPGALLVVILWVGGTAAVSYYINSFSQMSLIYGSLSGFIATLIFFYVMTMILIYGAEFNHELLVALGKRIVEREAPSGETIH